MATVGDPELPTYHAG
jgi:chromosome segregation ATPase